MGQQLPVYFDAPLINPAAGGLYTVTQWTEENGPLRWLDAGVEIRRHNVGAEDAVGVWGAAFNALDNDLSGDDVKTGTRPDNLDPFEPVTVWSFDQGDMTPESQVEVRTRAAQNLRMREQYLVEDEFGDRMLSDASSVGGDLGALENALAEAGVVGFIHAGAQVAAYAAEHQWIFRTPGGLKTPMGHTWVFGGGYYNSLSRKLVATTQPFGWRSEVAVRDTFETKTNTYAAIAERSVVVGYEAAIGYVDLD